MGTGKSQRRQDGAERSTSAALSRMRKALEVSFGRNGCRGVAEGLRRRSWNSAANANMRKSNSSTLESGRQCSPQFSIFQRRALYFTRVNWSNLCKHWCKVFRRWRPRVSAAKASTYCVGALVVAAHFRGLAGRTSMFAPQAWRWPKPSGQ